MNTFRVDGASLETEPPKPALAERDFERARAFQNRVVEWIQDGDEPVAALRAPTGGGKTATFHELIASREMTLLVYPTNALLRQQQERFEEDVDTEVLTGSTLEGHGPERTESLLRVVNRFAADHDVVLTNPDVLQAAIQGMYRGSDAMRFFDEFDAIVYDEFHFYDALAASGLLLQTKIFVDRNPEPKVLLASATPNEEFIDFLRNRVGLSIANIDATYDPDGDRFREAVTVHRREERRMWECRHEIAESLQTLIGSRGALDEPGCVLVFNSAKDSNEFHEFLFDAYPSVYDHAAKDNGYDTNDEEANLEDEDFFVLNTTSKGEVGLDYDVTTLHMEKPREASDFLQRFGRAGRQSPADVHVYGLGKGRWGDDVDFETFTRQIYDGLEATQMEENRLADLVGFRAAHAIATRERDTNWFNEELRADFEANVDQYGRWRRFIADVRRELEAVKDGFEPGKYVREDPEAKLLEFTNACFPTFRGLRGRSLPASVKYPRGDRVGLTTYDLTSTLRQYDVVGIEGEDVLVVEPTGPDDLSVVTVRLPAYETEPTRYDDPTWQIEKRLQTKLHRNVDQADLSSDFDVSIELLHRFFDIVRIVDAVVPERITTGQFEIEVHDEEGQPPTIDPRRRQL